MRTGTIATQVDAAPSPERGYHVRVTADGDLTDDSRVLEFNRSCQRVLDRRCDRLTVDARAVRQSDTKLIAILIALYGACRRRGIELELRLSETVHTWLGIYELHWMAEATADRSHE